MRVREAFCHTLSGGSVVDSPGETRAGRYNRRHMPSLKPPECLAGDEALARGAWTEAREAFEAALRERETPEALEGLGLAAWWLDLADVVFDSRERAYRLYRRARRPARRPRASRCGWRGTAGRSAASTPSPTAGSSAPVVCSRASRPARSARGSKCAKARCACSRTAIPSARTRMAGEGIRIARAVGNLDLEMLGRAVQGLCARRVGRGGRRHARPRRSEHGRRRRRADRSGRHRPVVLLHDRGVRSRARLRPRRPVVHAAQGVLREMGPASAVRRVPHAVRVDLHVARHVAEAEQELQAASDELAASRPAMTGDAPGPAR